MIFTLNSFLITHYYHSGFSAACGDTILIFDYWRGEDGELDESRQLNREILSGYQHIIVFISHEHPDHMDPVVFEWKDLPGISYIVASDMPVGTRGKRMAPGDTFEPCPDVIVSAFDSTDLGVSFLADFHGLRIFHAGDLNFWHWREESTMQEIEEAESEFRKALKPLEREKIDLAFYPVDPRQGHMFEAGANYFILSVKPRILIPMHYFHRADVAMEYARTASCRTTEVIVLPGYGDQLIMTEDNEGYLNLSFPERTKKNSPETEEEEVSPFTLSENDPFLESDLPLTQLSDHPQAVEKTDQEEEPSTP